MNIYKEQLKQHACSIELTLKQIENDIAHGENALELLKEQKEIQTAHLKLTVEAIEAQEEADA